MRNKIISIVLLIALFNGQFITPFYRAYADTPSTLKLGATLSDFNALQSAATDKTADGDGDGVYDEVERIYNTDPTLTDSDDDGLDDYFELFNGLNPLLADSNHDSVNDLYEIDPYSVGARDALLDSDFDGTPNVVDDDNDNDGVPDELDVSVNGYLDLQDSQTITIVSGDADSFVTLQLTPENIDILRTYDRIVDWPTDKKGEIQDIDGSDDDLTTQPYLKIDYLNSATMPDAQTCQHYGYTIQQDDDKTHLYLPLIPLKKDDQYYALQGTLFIPAKSGNYRPASDDYTLTIKTELAFVMTLKNDYLLQGAGNSAPIYCQGEPLIYHQMRDDQAKTGDIKQIVQTVALNINDNDAIDLIVIYQTVGAANDQLQMASYLDLSYNQDKNRYDIASKATVKAIDFATSEQLNSLTNDNTHATFLPAQNNYLNLFYNFYPDGNQLTGLSYYSVPTPTVYGAYNASLAHDISLDQAPVNDELLIANASYYNKDNDTLYYVYAVLDHKKSSNYTLYALKKQGEHEEQITLQQGTIPNYKNKVVTKKYNGKYYLKHDDNDTELELLSTENHDNASYAYAPIDLSLAVSDINKDGSAELLVYQSNYDIKEDNQMRMLYYIDSASAGNFSVSDLHSELLNQGVYDTQASGKDLVLSQFNIVANQQNSYDDIYIVDTTERQYSNRYPVKNFFNNDPFILSTAYSFNLMHLPAINTRSIILYDETKPFAITGLLVESQKTVRSRILAHDDNQMMLGLSQAVDIAFLNTPYDIDTSIDMALNDLIQNQAFERLYSDDIHANSNDAYLAIAKFFSDTDYVFRDEIHSYLIALEKRVQYANIDDFNTSDTLKKTSGDATAPLILNVATAEVSIIKEMTLKWSQSGYFLKPEDIVDMVTDNPDNIAVFRQYPNMSLERLASLLIGKMEVGGLESLTYAVMPAEKYVVQNFQNPVFLALKAPPSSVAGISFVATKFVLKSPMQPNHWSYRAQTESFKIKNLANSQSKMAKIAKFAKIGKIAGGIGTIVDAIFAVYNGYMLYKNLDKMGIEHDRALAVSAVFAFLYIAKAVIMIALLAIPVVGWIIFAAILISEVVTMLIFGQSWIDQVIMHVAMVFIGEQKVAGTYIETLERTNFKLKLKRLTDSPYITAGDSLALYDEYRTVYSAVTDNEANKKSILRNCDFNTRYFLRTQDKQTYNSGSLVSKDNVYRGDDELYKHDQTHYYKANIKFKRPYINTVVEHHKNYYTRYCDYVVVKSGQKAKPHFTKKTGQLLTERHYYDVLPQSIDSFYETMQFTNIPYISNNGFMTLGVIDRDGDGLLNSKQSSSLLGEYDYNGVKYSAAHIEKWDTDGDGLSDGIEAAIGSKIDNGDSDGDGLSDKQEYDLAINPLKVDSDGDGLDDFTEVNNPVIFTLYGAVAVKGYANPRLIDSDGDGLSDLEEYNLGSNPASKHTTGSVLYDGNRHTPELSTPFDNYYTMTDGETLTVDLDAHFSDGDGDKLVYLSDYGQIDEHNHLIYTYSSDNGVQIEISVTANDQRGGITNEYLLLVEDTEAPVITALNSAVQTTTGGGISVLATPVVRDSIIRLRFNEEIIVKDSSAIVIYPVDNAQLDVDTSGNPLGNSVDVLTTTGAAITTSGSAIEIDIKRHDGYTQNAITYQLHIAKSAIADTNGNHLQDDYHAQIEALDTTAPVLQTICATGDNNHPVVLEFNEPLDCANNRMRPRTLYVHPLGQPLMLTRMTAYYYDDRCHVDIPSNLLASNTTYQIASKMSIFKDVAGNLTSVAGQQFSTLDVSGPQCIQPEMVIPSPFLIVSNKAYQTQVNNGEIKIDFDEPIEKGNDFDHITLSHEANLYFYGCQTAGVQIKEVAAKMILPSTARIEGNSLIVTPTGDDGNQHYGVFIPKLAIVDRQGNPIGKQETYGKTDYLRVHAKSPTATISIVENDTIDIVAALAVFPKVASIFVPNGYGNQLMPSTTYQVLFNNIVDLQTPTSDGTVDLSPYISLSDQSGREIDKSSFAIISTKGRIKGFSSFTIKSDQPLEVGQTYTIKIAAGQFKKVSHPLQSNAPIEFNFTVGSPLDLNALSTNVLGEIQAGKTLYVNDNYLMQAAQTLSGTGMIDYQWYLGDSTDFANASLQPKANQIYFDLPQGATGQYAFLQVIVKSPYTAQYITPAIGPIAAPESDDASIANIALLNGETNYLTQYDSAQKNYHINVPAAVDHIKVAIDEAGLPSSLTSANGIVQALWEDINSIDIALEIGDNTITVTGVAPNGIDQISYTIDISRHASDAPEQLKPYVHYATIGGTSNRVGDQLIAQYMYQDDLNREEGASAIEWLYRTGDGQYQAIANANAMTYRLTEQDKGRIIAYALTPQTIDGVKGITVLSDTTQPVEVENEGDTNSNKDDTAGGQDANGDSDNSNKDIITDGAENGQMGNEQPAQVQFSDINSHWAQAAIIELASQAVIKGYPDGTFRPDQTISRADFVVLIARFFQFQTQRLHSFSDVVDNAYYNKAVSIVAGLGVVSGVGNNQFMPQAPLTRQDAVTILYRALQVDPNWQSYAQTALDNIPYFSDRPMVKPYAKQAVDFFTARQLLVGQAGKLYPNRPISRAEVTMLLKRLKSELD